MSGRAWHLVILLGWNGVFLQAQEEPRVNLDLGVITDSFEPGDSVEVPVTLVARYGPRVGGIRMEIGYPARDLIFLEAELGSGPTEAGAVLEVEPGPDGEDEEGGTRSVRLSLSSPNPISQGLLLTVKFETTHEVLKMEEILLENRDPQARSVDGGEIRTLGLDGSVNPIELIPACFFYMH